VNMATLHQPLLHWDWHKSFRMKSQVKILFAKSRAPLDRHLCQASLPSSQIQQQRWHGLTQHFKL